MRTHCLGENHRMVIRSRKRSMSHTFFFCPTYSHQSWNGITILGRKVLGHAKNIGIGFIFSDFLIFFAIRPALFLAFPMRSTTQNFAKYRPCCTCGIVNKNAIAMKCLHSIFERDLIEIENFEVSRSTCPSKIWINTVRIRGFVIQSIYLSMPNSRRWMSIRLGREPKAITNRRLNSIFSINQRFLFCHIAILSYDGICWRR